MMCCFELSVFQAMTKCTVQHEYPRVDVDSTCRKGGALVDDQSGVSRSNGKPGNQAANGADRYQNIPDQMYSIVLGQIN